MRPRGTIGLQGDKEVRKVTYATDKIEEREIEGIREAISSFNTDENIIT